MRRDKKAVKTRNFLFVYALHDVDDDDDGENENYKNLMYDSLMWQHICEQGLRTFKSIKKSTQSH